MRLPGVGSQPTRLPVESALRAAREVPGRQVERRYQEVAGEAARQQLRIAPDGPDGARGERLRERLREPEVPDRRPDPAVLDQPHAVPGEPGHDLGPRIENPGVPEVDDVDAALDAADQRIVVAVARRHDEARAQRPERPAALDRVARADRPAAGRVGRPTRMQDRPRYASLDEVDPAPRRALDVEPQADQTRVGDVVAKRDRAVELLLAEADERAPFLDGLGVEAVDEQEREQVRDRSRP